MSFLYETFNILRHLECNKRVKQTVQPRCGRKKKSWESSSARDRQLFEQNVETKNIIWCRNYYLQLLLVSPVFFTRVEITRICDRASSLDIERRVIGKQPQSRIPSIVFKSFEDFSFPQFYACCPCSAAISSALRIHFLNFHILSKNVPPRGS